MNEQTTAAPTAHETWDIDRLAPYARNARTHSKEQVEDIAESIEAFGMVGSIVVRNGTIAKGHGTLSAIRLIYGNGKLLFPAPGQHVPEEIRPVPYPEGTVPVLNVVVDTASKSIRPGKAAMPSPSTAG